MKITDIKLPFSMYSKPKPIEKLDGTETIYNWEEVNLKINFENINEGTLTIDSDKTYTYCIEKGVNYYLILDLERNYDTKKVYQVHRDIWSNNIENMKILENVNIVATSKEDVVEKNISTVSRLIEPKYEEQKNNLDSVFLDDAVPQFHSRAYLFASPSFFNNYQKETNNRFSLYEGKFDVRIDNPSASQGSSWVSTILTFGIYDIIDVFSDPNRTTDDNTRLIKVMEGRDIDFFDIKYKLNQFDFNVNKLSYYYDIFDNWPATAYGTPSGYNDYKTKIRGWKSLFEDYKTYGYNLFKLNTGNEFQTGQLRNYYILAPSSTTDNSEFSTITNQASPTSNTTNINCNVNNLYFSHYSDDSLNVLPDWIQNININYGSAISPIIKKNKNFVLVKQNLKYLFTNFTKEENVNFILDRTLNPLNNIRVKKNKGIYIVPKHFKIKGIPSSAKYAVFREDSIYGREVYFEINGGYMLVFNKNTQIKPQEAYITNIVKQNQGNLIRKIYSNLNIYLYNNAITLNGYVNDIVLHLYTSEGLTDDSKNLIEKMLKIKYKIGDDTFTKYLSSSENKDIADTNEASATEIYYAKKANDLNLKQMDREIITTDATAITSGFQSGLTGVIGGAAVGGGVGAAVGISASLIGIGASAYSASNQIKTMRESRELQKTIFNRKLNVMSRPIITNFQFSNVKFFKLALSTESGILMSITRVNDKVEEALKKYHKEFGYELIAYEDEINLEDYIGEYIQIEDNDILKQLPSKIATDNNYMNEVLKTGIIPIKVKESTSR